MKLPKNLELKQLNIICDDMLIDNYTDDNKCAEIRNIQAMVYGALDLLDVDLETHLKREEFINQIIVEVKFRINKLYK